MKKTCIGLLFLVAWLMRGIDLPEARAQKPMPSPVKVACERPEAIYKIGEKARFFITSTSDGQAVFRFSQDGFPILKEGQLNLEKNKTAELSGTLDKPGFLQLIVQQGKNKTMASAGFDPTGIQPTTRMPEDFDAFWEAGKKELAKIPLDPRLELSSTYTTDHVSCYKISLANVEGKRVRGWIAVPRGKGPFPAILTVPGAGVYGIGPDINHAKLGALSMNIIIHDLPVDESKEYYVKQAGGPLKDYRDSGMDDKNKSYFRAVILGCVRCLDYLASRSDFNGKDLGVTGGSQGGALTLITSGLDPRVTLAAPNVAAMCDHSGMAHNRVSGWPHWLHRIPGENKDKAVKVLETSAYYDAVNFARKFKGKSLHGVGFIDTVCAPTTVYAAFNVHPEPKTMIASPLMGHGTDTRWTKAREEFWKANMALKSPGKE